MRHRVLCICYVHVLEREREREKALDTQIGMGKHMWCEAKSKRKQTKVVPFVSMFY